MIDWGLAALVFGSIFVVELPDKTFVATLVLSTRYRPLLVWVGVGLAFAVQCVVAVSAGRLLGLLPEWVVHALTLVIFVAGAVILIRSAPAADDEEKEQEAEYAAKATPQRSGWAAVGTSFLVIFAAEWGDLSQLLTASLVSKHGSPVSAFVGAWAALLAVSGLAALTGRMLMRVTRLTLLHYIGAAVCLALAAWSAYELIVG